MAKPAILGLDGSGPSLEACLWVSDGIATDILPMPLADWPILRQKLPAGRGQAELLPNVITGLLAEAGLVAKDLRAIAVNLGPASFTSLRLGLAAAQGLSLAVGCPVYGYHGFALYHAMAGLVGSIGAGMAVIESGRKSWFCAYEDDEHGFEWERGRDADLLAKLGGRKDLPLDLYGPGASSLAEYWQEAFPQLALGSVVSCELATPLLTWLGYAQITNLDDTLYGGKLMPIHPLQPYYLRPPDVSSPSNQRSSSAVR